ncbi:MAG: glycosyltransferase family 4 protein [Anaerolineae bacterium]
MRIAINAWFLDRPDTGSGQYLHGLLRAMPAAAAEHEFLLVVPYPMLDLEIPGLRAEVWTFPIRTTRPGGKQLSKVLFEQVFFPRACRMWGADVAHVPYWGSPLWTSVPTVVTIHDLIPLLLPAYRGNIWARLYTWLVKQSARRAVAVLTDSLASQRDIEIHLKPSSQTIHCIYLAVGEAFCPEPKHDDETIRQFYGLPERYVLYLAGHDVRKNVAGLLRAFAIVAQADSDVVLVVGGRLPARSKLPLVNPQPLAQELDLLDRVRFIGWVEEAHKPALYRGAVCAAFPSHYEGFGLPVLEALACGTPLVTSNTSSLPEIVGDAGFAVDPDDERSLAGAILACLVDDSLATELRRRGPQQAAKFHWTTVAQDTLEVYQKVALCAS